MSGPPAWLFANNTAVHTTPSSALQTTETMAKTKKTETKKGSKGIQSSNNTTVSNQLLDLVQDFLHTNEFPAAYAAFKMERSDQGRGTAAATKVGKQTLLDLFVKYANTIEVKKASTSDSSDSDSSSDDDQKSDVEMKDADSSDSSDSSDSESDESDSSSDSDSESSSDDEAPAKAGLGASTAPTAKANPLKRKAASDSESSDSESSSDSSSDELSSEDEKPQVKKAKVASDSSDESSDSSDSESESEEEKPVIKKKEAAKKVEKKTVSLPSMNTQPPPHESPLTVCLSDCQKGQLRLR